MIDILQECIKTYPERPALDPAEWPHDRDQLEAAIDRTMARLAGFWQVPAHAGAAAQMMAAGLAAIESVRSMADALEACRPTKNQQLPGFRRPSWQRRA